MVGASGLLLVVVFGLILFLPKVLMAESQELCVPLDGSTCENFGCVTQRRRCIYPFSGQASETCTRTSQHELPHSAYLACLVCEKETISSNL